MVTAPPHLTSRDCYNALFAPEDTGGEGKGISAGSGGGCTPCQGDSHGATGVHPL